MKMFVVAALAALIHPAYASSFCADKKRETEFLIRKAVSVAEAAKSCWKHHCGSDDYLYCVEHTPALVFCSDASKAREIAYNRAESSVEDMVHYECLSEVNDVLNEGGNMWVYTALRKAVSIILR